MRGFIDLHCHFVPGIDDGARTIAEGVQMLEALSRIGFSRVIATPHMRPGLFDNQRGGLVAAFEQMLPHIRAVPGLPEVELSSEHYFDDMVFERVLNGQGLPYPGQRAVLLEFYEMEFPTSIDRSLSLLRIRGLLPVIAHPERYRAIWRNGDTLERLIDAGAAALLDVAALAGKYGQRPQRSAEELLDRGLYHAACSDAHRPADADAVLAGMRVVEERFGPEEVDFLFREGPLELLAGRLPD
jgi:protein-tyrosine phosphatase